MQFESMAEEIQDIPDLVVDEEDLDDDLELLEDLEDLWVSEVPIFSP